MSDLDDLEEVEALFEYRPGKSTKRIRAGKRAFQQTLDRQSVDIVHRRLASASRRKAPPITLAGPKS